MCLFYICIYLMQILVALVDVGKPRELDRALTGQVEEEETEMEEEERRRRDEEMALVMGRLTESCLERLITCLTHGRLMLERVLFMKSTDVIVTNLCRFVKQEWEKMSTELSRVALFRYMWQSNTFYAFWLDGKNVASTKFSEVHIFTLL